MNAAGQAVEVDADPRWVGNGRTILNNKGNPVKQYEPYFSTTHEYEDEKVLREIGVTPILYYDAGRPEHPHRTRTARSPESSSRRGCKAFDANDTVKESHVVRGSRQPRSRRRFPSPAIPNGAPRGSRPSTRIRRASFTSTASAGPSTPSPTTAAGETAAARTRETDLTGRYVTLFDQGHREVASGFSAWPARPSSADSAEKGQRWTFQNVLGALVKSWDEHGRVLPRRVRHAPPAGQHVRQGGRTARRSSSTTSSTATGTRQRASSSICSARASRLRSGRPGPDAGARLQRQPGVGRAADREALPGNGRLERRGRSGRMYAAIRADGGSGAGDRRGLHRHGLYDALNRPMRVTLPDGTILEPTYNEAGFLASLRAQIRGQRPFIDFLKEQDYDAKGQRQFARYGNDLLTRYFYDAKTFRLTRLLTYPDGADPRRRRCRTCATPTIRSATSPRFATTPADPLLQQRRRLAGDAVRVRRAVSTRARHRPRARGRRQRRGPHRARTSRSGRCRTRTTPPRCAPTPRSTTTTCSATSGRCSTGSRRRRAPAAAGRATTATPTTTTPAIGPTGWSVRARRATRTPVRTPTRTTTTPTAT